MTESRSARGVAAYYARLNHQIENWLLWILAAVLVFGIAGILSYTLIQESEVDVTLNLPASEDIRANQQTEYVSQVLTDAARDAAGDTVPDIFTQLDRQIGRTQVDATRSLFSYVKVVRADTTSPPEHLLSNLEAISIVPISADIASTLLDMSQVDLDTAEDEALRIVSLLMRDEVRGNDLTTMAQQVERVAPFFTENEADQEAVILGIVPQLIQPNIFFDQAATEEARQLARDEVTPVLQEWQKDEIIIRSGQRVNDWHLETLQELGLLQVERNWWQVGRLFLISTMAVGLLMLYYIRYIGPIYQRRRYAILLTVLLLGSVGVAQFLLNQQVLLRYLFPAAAISMLLAVVYDTRFAAFVTLLVGGLVGYAANGSLEYAFYAIVGSLIAVLSLRGAERLNDFFRAGLLAAVGNFAVILLFNFSDSIDWLEFGQLLGYAVASGGLSAMLTITGFYVIGTFFGIITVLQIQELSRFDQPLLQELLRNAPGTYHHSIMVANMAERAAEEIGANSLLVRVGAFYHDIGKMVQAPYFTENQEGHNPHDHLDPYESADIIIGHVTNGLEMARQHRLPERLHDFIAEHHGDQVLTYFYKKACDNAGAEDADTAVEIVDKEYFRYPGPAPRSRETAVVLLADSVEAASKAVQPNNEAAIEKLVVSITEGMLIKGQLDNSGLTMGDIQKVRASFMETLHGRFHVRVKYAGNESLVAANTPPIEGEVSEAAASADGENLLPAPEIAEATN